MDVNIIRVQHDGRTTLDQLRPGAHAVVCSVGGTRAEALRLMEMGLLRGTLVELVRIAPFGDPVELRLRGYSLSIRLAQARGVTVMAVAALEAAE